MFSLESNVRYFMCQHPVSMRKGIDSLFNLVISESPMSPMTGDVFVFFSKNRQSVKLLKWDTDGFLLYQKRLERGSFEMPRKNARGLSLRMTSRTIRMHKAANYFLNELDDIKAIADYDDVEWDNNRLERVNRYVSLSRHSSLFFGSHTGAKRGCIFYSLACSCREMGINFFEYLSDILNQAATMPPGASVDEYAKLLPNNWIENKQGQ